jgi:AcrR family transcriptional regulator
VGNAAGDRTRAALIRSGEQLMARHGIEGAQLQDVVKLAGQRNRSAVVFHFGSREGLLRAIVAKHRPGINDERNRMLDELDAADHATIRDLVDVLVQPYVRKLRSPSGRDYLIIMGEVAARQGGAGLVAASGKYTDGLERANRRLLELLTSDNATRRRRLGEIELIAPILIADIARDISRRALTVRASAQRVDSVIDLMINGMQSLDPCHPGPTTDRRHLGRHAPLANC